MSVQELARVELELPDGWLDEVAQEVVRRLWEPPDNWIDLPTACEYLATSKHRLYKLTAAGAIPHEHDGQRLLFRRSELDEWVRAGGARSHRRPTPRVKPRATGRRKATSNRINRRSA